MQIHLPFQGSSGSGHGRPQTHAYTEGSRRHSHKEQLLQFHAAFGHQFPTQHYEKEKRLSIIIESGSVILKVVLPMNTGDTIQFVAVNSCSDTNDWSLNKFIRPWLKITALITFLSRNNIYPFSEPRHTIVGIRIHSFKPCFTILIHTVLIVFTGKSSMTRRSRTTGGGTSVS